MDLDSDIFGSQSTNREGLAQRPVKVLNDVVPINNITTIDIPARTDFLSELLSLVKSTSYGLNGSSNDKQNNDILTPIVHVYNRDTILLDDLYLDAEHKVPIDYLAFQKVENLHSKIMTADKFTFVMPTNVRRYLKSLVDFQGDTQYLRKRYPRDIERMHITFTDRTYYSPSIRMPLSEEIQSYMVECDAFNMIKCRKISPVMELFIKRMMFKFECGYSDASKLLAGGIHIIHLIDGLVGLNLSQVNFNFIMHINWIYAKDTPMDYINQFKHVITGEYSAIDKEWLPKIFHGFLTLRDGVIYTKCSRTRKENYPGYPVYMTNIESPVLVAWGKPDLQDVTLVSHGFLGASSITTTIYTKTSIPITYMNRTLTVPIFVMDLFTDIIDNIIYLLTGKSRSIIECVALYTSAHAHINECSGDIISIYAKLMYSLSHPTIINKILSDKSSSDTALSDALTRTNKQGNYVNKSEISKAIFHSLNLVDMKNTQPAMFMQRIMVCPCTVSCLEDLPDINKFRC